jgi:7,8-dihydropterin-6-yl-methyl-4-(beta-D-ribofuranosyl)aminobenzene 5'-phosphate synthase
MTDTGREAVPRPRRLAPLWWPVLGLAAPVVLPLALLKNRRYTRNRARAVSVNEARIHDASALELPELASLELTVLVEQESSEGFLGAPGVSYLVTTDRGRLLFDVGFGPESPSLVHNCRRLGVTLDDVDQLVISHLHLDHMGGAAASRKKTVTLPPELGEPHGKPCYLPSAARAPGFAEQIVERPQLLGSGIGSTGPLARSLFFMGWTEEQALVANLRGKGLVLVTGCGHPTLEVMLRMLRRLSDVPIHAVVGGLHLPIEQSRLRKAGVQLQMFFGTGKPPWQRIDADDLDRTIETIDCAAPDQIYLSAHDTCGYSIERIRRGVRAPVEVLRAGESYQL